MNDRAPDLLAVSRCAECSLKRSGPAMPIGRVLALVGGLAMVLAFWMPWFGAQVGAQGIILTGSFLTQFLGGTTDLRRVMPGASGGAGEVTMLLGLIYLFPSVGALAGLLSLVGMGQGRLRRLIDMALVGVGIVPLVALGIGLTRLPPGSSRELGLWIIGLGALAILVGALFDLSHVRKSADSMHPER